MLLYKFLLLCNAFVFCLKKQNIFFRKSCVDFNFISLIHSYVYIHKALCYQKLYLKDTYNSLAMWVLSVGLIYLSRLFEKCFRSKVNKR